MKLTQSRSVLLIVMTLFATGLFYTAVAKACDVTAARALSIQGQVERLTEEKIWTAVELNESLCPGDHLHIGAGSRASLLLDDDTLLRLAENSSVTINGRDEGGGTWLDLLEGIAHFISRVRRGFQVNTPYINAGVEGTEFTVESAADYAVVTVLEGRVKAHNDWGEVLLKGGQKAVAHAGEAPRIERVVDPLDAVRWTLYYPPVSDSFLAHASMAGQRSFEAYRRGDIEGAFAALARESEIEQDAALLAYRAALRLRVGGVNEARRDLTSALRLEPEQADALSLLSIISTVENQRQEALELAQRALAAAPMELSPLLALSYARQARFQLPAALEAAKQATRAAPGSALAWSQLARLYLMFHEVDEADTAARRAVAIAPNRSYGLVTLGFVQLIRMEFEHARQSFEQAVTLNGAAAPLPRLGLGLLEIRQGHLADGRRQLEIAANLDPGNAMIRSYLGRAYYEEKRDKRAAAQFALAKQLDELDPTAWFYNAILQLSANRPNEALDELQTAIDLNDNRAVYRSRYLLDQDEAARIDTLGRIYADTGFMRPTRAEAYKSLQTDASNYSAHRLLADTNKTNMLFDKARRSELLQAQLLQPLNRHPLQAKNVYGSPGIIDSAGPIAGGFSEYAPLFTSRNGLDLQIIGFGGDYHTLGDDLILSGLHDRIAFSLAQSRYKTEGWRENSDIEDNARDAFLQVALTPATSLQYEYIKQDVKHGDPAIRFEPDDFSDSNRYGMEKQVRRIGLHHQFVSNGHLILSLIDQDLQESYLSYSGFDTTIPGQPPGNVYPVRVVDAQSTIPDIKSQTYEFQFIQPFHAHTFILGAGRYDEAIVLNLTNERTINLLLPDPPFLEPIASGSVPPFPLQFDFDPGFKNIYLYSQLALPDRARLTLGVSHDEFEGWSSKYTSNRTNRKVGLTWEVWKNSLFRAAYIENTSRPNFMQRTIEPTQIAGFNQLLDIANDGSEIRQSGLGADIKLSRTLRIGAEFTRHKDLRPQYGLAESGVTGVDFYGYKWKDYDIYLHWLATKKLGIYMGHEKELIDMKKLESQEVINTRHATVGFDYRWPFGIYLKSSATYVDQHIDLDGEHKQDDFWYVHSAVGYRLPKRYGRVEIFVKNLFDKSFKSTETGLALAPERQMFARFAINL